MKNLLLIASLILITACGSFRPSNDTKIEAITGIRTMRSWSGWTVEDNVKMAIDGAKKRVFS